MQGVNKLSWVEINEMLMEDDIENGTRGVVQPGGGASSLMEGLQATQIRL